MSAPVARCLRFIKDWALPLTMLLGISAYFAFHALPVAPHWRILTRQTIGVVQPALIFCMLFLSFCKINPKEVRPARWTWPHLALQAAGFVLPALAIVWLAPQDSPLIWLECAMACLICPTATAAAIITDRLGGDLKTVVAYTMAINLVAALLISAFIPLINPTAGLNFGQAFGLIAAKVFPLLVLPFLLAWAVRLWCPGLLQYLLKIKDLAFYLWIVALALAMAVTTRALMHSHIGPGCLLGIAAVTLTTCLLQFGIGRLIGRKYHDTISAGQALGQKNTVFIIWMAYTFLHPVTAVAGGFYSIWHNLINSWHLHQKSETPSV
ncbi:MAG: transporter [Paludibacteraceae bacterium]|nr:transporter [Paludibacteraceae bacterium]